MRINQFVARASGLSRRASDQAIASGRVKINGETASVGQQVTGKEDIRLWIPRVQQASRVQGTDEQRREPYTQYGDRAAQPATPQSAAKPGEVGGSAGEFVRLVLRPSVTIMLNKPVGYVCSRAGQGARTIYDLLPPEYQSLKTVGRLDKDSSGLLLLTSDGQLAQELTHPKFAKQKIYQIELDKTLTASDKSKIEQGVKIEDGISRLALAGSSKAWTATMSEGRNRQIRRTFAALNYEVIKLHRTQFGDYQIAKLKSGEHHKI